MSKSMEGGKSGAIEGSKKRNPYIMPTIRQLAYLDELKTRLLLMRERQAIFMEQTAKMLNGISSVNMVGNSVLNEPAADGALPLPEVNEDEAEESKSNPNIKTLIQRFEDLCQTSQKFTDLPDVPEELVNVDVRRILKGYEKLIEEENIIQQSWLLLRNSTESCVRFTTKEQPMEQPNQTNLTETEEVSEVASKSSFQVIVPQILTSSLYPNVAKSEDSEDKEGWRVFEPKNDFKESSTAVTRGHKRWGPFMRLMIRLLKPLHGSKKCSKKPNQKCPRTLTARKTRITGTFSPATQNAQVEMQI